MDAEPTQIDNIQGATLLEQHSDITFFYQGKKPLDKSNIKGSNINFPLSRIETIGQSKIRQ